MTETHLRPEETEFFSLPNFVGYHSCRINRPGGGGGASIFIREGLNANLIFKYATTDNNIIQIKLIEYNIFIACIYRTTDEPQFYDILEELSERSNTLIVGDVNLNLLDLANRTVIDYVELMHSCGFAFLNKIHTDSTTRATSGTIIDHFITNNFRFKYDLKFDDHFRLDHKIGLLSVETGIIPRKQTEYFAKTIIDHASIIRDQLLGNLQDVDTFDELLKRITEVLRSRTNTINGSRKKIGRKPWITRQIIDLIKDRDKFYRKHIKYPNNSFWETAFLNTRNCLQNLIRDRQLEYYSSKICEFAHDSSRLWGIFNELIFGKNRRIKTSIPALKLTDGSVSTNEQDITDELNCHFATTAELLVTTIPSAHVSSNQLNYRITYPFSLTLTTFEEINKALNELKPKAAVGIDGISTKTLKIHNEHLIPVIVRLINEHLTNGTYP
jgi:hypothetical protein